HDAELRCKGLDRTVFFEIGRRGVLDVMVQRKDRLGWIGHFLRADLPEFGNHGAGIVVGHNVEGPDGDHVAGADLVAGFKVDGVGLDDLLGDGLGHGTSRMRWNPRAGFYRGGERDQPDVRIFRSLFDFELHQFDGNRRAEPSQCDTAGREVVNESPVSEVR
ncbi:MAG: hypothetical protein DRJ61_16315, partial [Acidobacteria bacterium]